MSNEAVCTICEIIGAASVIYGAIKGITTAVRSWVMSRKRKEISKESDAEAAGRDTTKYLLDDENTRYGKGRLVLATVRKFISKNPNCTVEGLMQIFPDQWQGKYLVRSTASTEWAAIGETRQMHDFFMKPDEMITLKDGSQIAVCRQWGIDNIDAFINGVRGLGFKVEPIASKTNINLKSLLITIVSAFALSGFSASETVDGVVWNYTIIDGHCHCTGPSPSQFNFLGGPIIVPEYLGGKQVEYVYDWGYYAGHITSVTFPSSLKGFGQLGSGDAERMFYAWNKLGTLIFTGNAPTIKQLSASATPFSQRSFTVYVMPSTSGWGVTIPGTWKKMPIKYLKSVNFDANGGIVDAQTRWLTDDAEVGTLPTPTHPGATFTGWFTAAMGGTIISATTTISANQTFYAHWSLNSYMITFDACEGTGGSSRVQTYGTTLGSLPVPTRSGHLFCGWFTEVDGGAQINDDTKVDGERTYYAHWVRDPIPELASGETVADALSGAVDSTLNTRITTKKEYSAFRSWVDYSALIHSDVKGSPNAWLAYALDAPGLIAKPSAVAKEDFTFEAGSSVAEEPGKMAFDFGIDGVTIGEEAELDEVFVITGAATLEESAFTESGVTASLERTSDGKVSVSVEPPKDGNGKIPDKYFFRVKVK